MSSAECRFRPAIGFIVPSSPTSGHRTLELVGLIQREHAKTSSNMPSDLRERLDAAFEGLIDILALQVQGQIENELADGIVDLWFEDIIDILTKADGYNSPEEFAAGRRTPRRATSRTRQTA
jgi:hypothetical protein